MKLHCLGTAGYHPNESRHTSCYFLPASGIVLDAGSGFFRLPPLIETDWLDIFISHAHADHVIGLTYLLDVLYQRPVSQVRVWGHIDKLTSIQNHLLSDPLFPVPLDVQWCPLQSTQTTRLPNNVAVTLFPLIHPGGSWGFRFDWHDCSLAYVTDTTGPSPSAFNGESYLPSRQENDYIPWIHQCDLLLHECNFRDSQKDWALKTGHTWTSRAAEVALASGADRLLLIHINPLEVADDPVGLDCARRIFPQSEVAHDGLIVEFGSMN